MYQIFRDALDYVKKQCVDVRLNLFITLDERKLESGFSVPLALDAETQSQFHQSMKGLLPECHEHQSVIGEATCSGACSRRQLLSNRQHIM